MTVYGDEKSGNCYKIKLTLHLLNIEYQWKAVDLMKGETTTPAFLAKSPQGKLPIIELTDGRVLAESNAIIGYLAGNSELVPKDEFDKALMYQWMFYEQYTHEPCIAVARFIQLYQNMPVERQSEYDSLHAKGAKILGLLDQQLSDNLFIIGSQFTLADIALYAYTHVAHEGGFDLTHYVNINNWLERVTKQRGYVSMFG
ncbi:glutathione S-transferase family protein [Shewanella goraebulensis]|uniref:glutathione S-transferase family protein n=1 Tax=Shewanella goraebulensis TaxID=3050637 RepID=UPI00254BC070|nr:glutathione S-transferase family protein [Shewanella goraebulensis]